MIDRALTRWNASPMLRVIDGGMSTGSSTDASPWWEQRAAMREVVGGCPDHWWNPTARRTARCTCDRFTS